MDITSLLSISLGAILVNNFILVQFLGICPFMGVSKKMDTAVGMGFAVIFVMGLASALCYPVNQLLVRLDLEYMQTVAFILVIAALVQEYLKIRIRNNLQDRIICHCCGYILETDCTNAAEFSVGQISFVQLITGTFMFTDILGFIHNDMGRPLQFHIVINTLG